MVPVSAITARDRDNLQFALDHGVDWIALSFVQRPDDVEEAYRLVDGRAALMVKVRAKASDGEVRFFGDEASRMDAAIEQSDVNLRVHVSGRAADPAALKARLDRSRAQGPGRGGEGSLSATLEGRREGEVKLPGRYRLDAALRGARKTVPGVVLLEEA